MRTALVFALALALGLGLAGCKPKKSESAAGGTAPATAQKAGGMETLDYQSDAPVRNFEKPEVVTDHKKYDYYAVLETSKGTFTIDLLEDSAPNTVNSFVFLALHRYFDGLRWHRVVPGFVAQTGDPTGRGSGGPGYRFGLEIDPNLSYDAAGWVGMARTNDPNTNGSQFFITLAPAPHLTGGYTIFGKVVEGMDVVEELTQQDTIRTVRILRKPKP
ncbi:peptidylprolyl isomerase [Oceanithermus sp.]|nr:peptidylprolyl isomerase [Oceanithermus sp.]